MLLVGLIRDANNPIDQSHMATVSEAFFFAKYIENQNLRECLARHLQDTRKILFKEKNLKNIIFLLALEF
jgi:hypothetical protein